MAYFYIRLTDADIAKQIAGLLNKNNALKNRLSAYSILNSHAVYFIELYGSQVVGCSAIQQVNNMLTRQFHLSVHPDFRRRGIAGKLKAMGIAETKTPFIYVTVRDDNTASLRLQQKFGFVYVRQDPAVERGRVIYTLARATRPEEFSTQQAHLRRANHA